LVGTKKESSSPGKGGNWAGKKGRTSLPSLYSGGESKNEFVEKEKLVPLVVGKWGEGGKVSLGGGRCVI